MTFNPAITLTLKFKPSDLVGVDMSTLKIAFWDGTSWQVIAASSVNTVTGEVNAPIAHFTPYAILGKKPVATPVVTPTPTPTITATPTPTTTTTKTTTVTPTPESTTTLTSTTTTTSTGGTGGGISTWLIVVIIVVIILIIIIIYLMIRSRRG